MPRDTQPSKGRFVLRRWRSEPAAPRFGFGVVSDKGAVRASAEAWPHACNSCQGLRRQAVGRAWPQEILLSCHTAPCGNKGEAWYGFSLYMYM